MKQLSGTDSFVLYGERGNLFSHVGALAGADRARDRRAANITRNRRWND